MPDVIKREINLDSLTNRELLEFMNSMIDGDPERFDEALFFAAQRLLDERAPLDNEIDVKKGLKEFHEENKELFEEKRKAAGSKSRRRHGRRFLKGLAAVIAAIFVINSIAAIATGVNPLLDLGETLFRVMTSGPSGNLELPEGTEGYLSLAEALNDTDAEDALCITWIPAEYNLTNVRVIDREGPDGGYREYWAYYEGKGGNLIYHILNCQPLSYGFYSEQNPGAESIEVNGLSVEIVRNNDKMQANWKDDSYVYSLTGSVNRGQIETIIKTLK